MTIINETFHTFLWLSPFHRHQNHQILHYHHASYSCIKPTVCKNVTIYFDDSFSNVFLQQELKAQIDDHKAPLDDAEKLCDWLTNKNKDQPLVAASIKDKFDKVEQPYNILRAKVFDLEGRLQAAQMRTQEFQVSHDDFKDKLGELEQQAADLKPVSAVYDALKDQQDVDEVSEHRKRSSTVVEIYGYVQMMMIE